MSRKHYIDTSTSTKGTNDRDCENPFMRKLAESAKKSCLFGETGGVGKGLSIRLEALPLQLH